MAAAKQREVVNDLVHYLLELDDNNISVANVLLHLIRHNLIKNLIGRLSLYSVMARMLLNMGSELRHIARHDHQSGLYQFLVASVSGHETDPKHVAELLQIDVRTAKKALRHRLGHGAHFNRHGNHRSHLMKKKAKRPRVSLAIRTHIADFIEDHTVPTSDSKRVKILRNALGHAVSVPIRYRTDTIKQLHKMFTVCI